jgi:transcriptional regulator with XRE-family HTH domain
MREGGRVMNALRSGGATLTPVRDETRGQEVRRRRLRHGIKSLREFADKSGISREALTAAESGTASDATYERIAAWFDRFEEEVGDEDLPSSDVVEFRIADIDVIVKGPVSHIAELEEAVAKLVLATRRTRGTEG